MTVSRFLAECANAEEYERALEYDQVEPPLTRNDMEEFFGLLAMLLNNAHFKEKTRADDYFPGLYEREKQRKKLAAKYGWDRDADGKPIISHRERLRRNSIRFHSIAMKVDAELEAQGIKLYGKGRT